MARWTLENSLLWHRFFMKRLTREWVGKAEDDYQAAHRLSEVSRRLHDQV